MPLAPNCQNHWSQPSKTSGPEPAAQEAVNFSFQAPVTGWYSTSILGNCCLNSGSASCASWS